MVAREEGSRRALLLRLVLKGEVLRTFAFDQDVVRIGRDPGADVQLSSQNVSRIHCKIERQQDSFVLVDNGSTNGTCLDGQRVRCAELRTGQVIRVEAFELRVAVVSTRHDQFFSTSVPHATPTIRNP